MVNYLLPYYSPPPPSEDRDIALGQFMHMWAELEFQLLFLFHTLTDTTLEIASIIFATGFQCSNLIEIFLALGQMRLLDSEYRQLKSLCNRYGKSNAKLNKIIHGYWWIEHDPKSSYGTQWIRRYSPVNPNIEKQISDKKNQKNRSTYRFTIKQLITTTEQLKSLVEDMGQFHFTIMNYFDLLDSDKEDEQS